MGPSTSCATSPSITRRERSDSVRKRHYFTKYGARARQVLDALLDKYADDGIEQIEDIQVLRIQPLSDLGTPMEIVREFGGKPDYVKAVRELELAL